MLPDWNKLLLVLWQENLHASVPFSSTLLVSRPIILKMEAIDHNVFMFSGAGNHRYFMGYLFFLLFMICWMIYGCISCEYGFLNCFLSTQLNSQCVYNRNVPGLSFCASVLTTHRLLANTVWLLLVTKHFPYSLPWTVRAFRTESGISIKNNKLHKLQSFFL